MGYGQRPNGGWGCDLCAGARDEFLRPAAEIFEACWCCTMRGAEGLARAMVDDYGDQVQVMILTQGEGELRSDLTVQPQRLVVELSENPLESGETVVEALNEHAPKCAYTILDASELGLSYIDFLVDTLRLTELDPGLYVRLVKLAEVNHGRPPNQDDVEGESSTWSVLNTTLLGAEYSVNLPPVEMAKAFLKRFRLRAGLWTLGQRSRSHPESRNPVNKLVPEEVRIRLTFPRNVDPMSCDVSGSFSRWARAISDRRVGLALAGSGSWGFAHCALIDELEDRGIPIDLIASASSGSVIGSFYTVLGRPGTALAMQRGNRLQFTSYLAMLTSAAVEGVMALDLGFPLLNQFEVMFYPVVTNLTKMSPEYITSATVPWGVRASSTAPGVFGSTMVRDAIYVDGAIADNVPARLVEALGADLVIAANPLPPPPLMHPRGWAPSILHEFNLLFRIRALMSSFDLMFHDLGDTEAAGYILYDPPAAAFPLLRTFDFKKAQKIYDAVKEEPRFIETLELCETYWSELTEARCVA